MKDTKDISKEELKDFVVPQNKILSSTIRMTTMIILLTHRKVKISELQKLLQISPGKMDHHAKVLENEGFVIRRGQIFKKRLLTILEITEKGESNIREYVKELYNVISKIG
ncbi:MAG: transcriptional regulator [Candidatus Hodarchaeales archaeon]|jgi:DNA-binding MarR family transcriptional regulator